MHGVLIFFRDLILINPLIHSQLNEGQMATWFVLQTSHKQVNLPLVVPRRNAL